MAPADVIRPQRAGATAESRLNSKPPCPYTFEEAGIVLRVDTVVERFETPLPDSRSLQGTTPRFPAPSLKVTR